MREVRRHFGIRAVSIPKDPREAGPLTEAFGPSLGLYERPPHWITLAAGNFADGGPSIRCTVAGPARRTENVLEPGVKTAFRSSAVNVAFEQGSTNSAGGDREAAPEWHDWLDKMDGSADCACIDLAIPLSRFTATTASPANHWMSRFLREIHREDQLAGVALLLRPAENPETHRSALAGLRRLFQRISVRSHTVQRQFTEDKRGSHSWQAQNGAELVRRRTLVWLEELISTGAWWVTVRAFGGGADVAQRVAGIYWSCISATDRVSQPGHSEWGRVPRLIDQIVQREPDAWERSLSHEPPKTLKEMKLASEGSHSDRKKLYHRLSNQGLDLLFDCPGGLSSDGAPAQLRDRLNSCQRLTYPHKTEILASGRRLSAAFQLPVESTPLLEVVNGFSFCSPGTKSVDTAGVPVGHVTAGGVLDADPAHARLGLDTLRKHTLITGATGAGKTTTVLTLLKGTRELNRDVKVTILEGAKREYREHSHLTGVESVFDFVDKFLPIPMFDHPEYVSPEAHLCRISSIFDATLEMPPPIPAIVRQALFDAYSSFHDEPENSPLRREHPIRFWLFRSIRKLADQLGYQGDVQATINGALRTRLGALSMGMPGKILAGGVGWQKLARRFSEESVLMELEGIADRRSRALIMSLFVLYYRYSLTRRSENLERLLVLEEAHRIIGTSAGHQDTDPSLDFFGNMLSEVRSYGCGIVISDQSPARLIDDAMRNTNTKFIMRLVSGEDIRNAVVGAGLSKEAMNDIPKLRQFQAVLITPDDVPRLVQIDPLSVYNKDTAHTEPDNPTLPAGRRKQLKRDVTLTGLYFDSISELYGGRSSSMKAAFKQLSKRSGLDEEALLADGRDLCGCQCDVGSQFTPCQEHEFEPFFAVLPTVAGKVSQ